jgi:hypothetical protein
VLTNKKFWHVLWSWMRLPWFISYGNVTVDTRFTIPALIWYCSSNTAVPCQDKWMPDGRVVPCRRKAECICPENKMYYTLADYCLVARKKIQFYIIFWEFLKVQIIVSVFIHCIQNLLAYLFNIILNVSTNAWIISFSDAVMQSRIMLMLLRLRKNIQFWLRLQLHPYLNNAKVLKKSKINT